MSEDAHSKYTACRAVTPKDIYLGSLVGLEGAFLLLGGYLSYKVKDLPSDFNGVYCWWVSHVHLLSNS